MYNLFSKRIKENTSLKALPYSGRAYAFNRCYNTINNNNLLKEKILRTGKIKNKSDEEIILDVATWMGKYNKSPFYTLTKQYENEIERLHFKALGITKSDNNQKIDADIEFKDETFNANTIMENTAKSEIEIISNYKMYLKLISRVLSTAVFSNASERDIQPGKILMYMWLSAVVKLSKQKVDSVPHDMLWLLDALKCADDIKDWRIKFIFNEYEKSSSKTSSIEETIVNYLDLKGIKKTYEDITYESYILFNTHQITKPFSKEILNSKEKVTEIDLDLVEKLAEAYFKKGIYTIDKFDELFIDNTESFIEWVEYDSHDIGEKTKKITGNLSTVYYNGVNIDETEYTGVDLREEINNIKMAALYSKIPIIGNKELWESCLDNKNKWRSVSPENDKEFRDIKVSVDSILNDVLLNNITNRLKPNIINDDISKYTLRQELYKHMLSKKNKLYNTELQKETYNIVSKKVIEAINVKINKIIDVLINKDKKLSTIEFSTIKLLSNKPNGEQELRDMLYNKVHIYPYMNIFDIPITINIYVKSESGGKDTDVAYLGDNIFFSDSKIMLLQVRDIESARNNNSKTLIFDEISYLMRK